MPKRIMSLHYKFNKFLQTYLIFHIQAFFISNAFFNSASVLLNFFINRALSVALVLLSTYKHYHNETLFTFTISVSMSRPSSIYVASM